MGEKKDKKKKAKGAKKAHKRKARKKAWTGLDPAAAVEEEAAQLLLGEGFGATARAEEAVADVADAVVRGVPERWRVSAAAELAVPAVRTLSRLRRNDPRAQMLRRLLVRACDARWAPEIHGHFADLVAQLYPDEARLLEQLAAGRSVERREAAYPMESSMYRIRAVDCDVGTMDMPSRMLLYLEHLRALYLVRLVTGSPPGQPLRNDGGGVVGHLVNHRAILTDYGADLCASCFPERRAAWSAEAAEHRADTGTAVATPSASH